MKYKPTYDLSVLHGSSNHFIYNIEESDNSVDIYLKSKSHNCKCPTCGEESSSLHATYQRKIQDTPIHNKITYLRANVYKYNCTNPNCPTKVFMEQLPFASASQVRTDALNSMILSVAMFLSNEGASKVLKLLGVKISNDGIQRLYDRIQIIDNADVEKIGVDDVATRKGQKYATAIYDMKDHRMLALLEGRDGETLKEWLKNHDKVKVVARDRASAYASAIKEILPDCMQVADRFHLMQNLLVAMKEIFKEEIPTSIFIKEGKILDEEPKKIWKENDFDETKLDGISYDNSVPVDENGKEIEFNSKRRDIDGKEYKELEENRKKNKN